MLQITIAANCPKKTCPGDGFVGQDCKCWCDGTSNPGNNKLEECGSGFSEISGTPSQMVTPVLCWGWYNSPVSRGYPSPQSGYPHGRDMGPEIGVPSFPNEQTHIHKKYHLLHLSDAGGNERYGRCVRLSREAVNSSDISIILLIKQKLPFKVFLKGNTASALVISADNHLGIGYYPLINLSLKR